MKRSLYRMAFACCLLGGLLFGAAAAEAAVRSSLNGFAALSYTTYDADADGRRLFSGDSLVQQYSVAWSSTNLVYRDQPQYYSIMAGYDWTAYNTSVTSPTEDLDLKDTYGKFRYNGAIGYSPPGFPVRVTAYMADDAFPRLRYDIFGDTALINDGLVYDLEGRGKSATKGITVDFYPDQALQQNLRGLPRIHLDYREWAIKSEDRFSTTDMLTSQTQVSLGKGSNWFNYRRIETKNNRDSNDTSVHEQVQLGHVDFVGRRQWTGLTNWIAVSADGQLTTTDNGSSENRTEEYDINLMATATRKSWQARTFLNYNRYLTQQDLTEVLRVPLSINGVWGPDIEWHASARAIRGRESESVLSPVQKTYSYALTAGANLFLRSKFTLSPTLMLQIDKAYSPKEAYEAGVGVETSSTSRFSDKLFLSAAYLLRARDDGYGTDESTTWSNQFTFQGKYLPSQNLYFDLRQIIDAGNGSGYIDPRWLANDPDAASGLKNYFRSTSAASAGYWSATFSAGLTASYDLIMTSGLPDKTQILLNSDASYRKDSVQFNFRMTYDQRDSGMGDDAKDVYGLLELLYRPNRYQEGSMRYTLTKTYYAGGGEETRGELLQRQTYRYFSRSGVARDIASITQEFSYLDENSIVSKYLLLSGRYSPTSRLTLHGSAKYFRDPYSDTMWYTAGVAIDFRLLYATIDYSLAKRDKDNRTEKKLTATVTRSF